MFYAASVLNKIISGKQIFRVIIFYAFQWTVFSVFSINTVHDCHRYLDICIVDMVPFHNKIAFLFTDTPDTNIISLGSGVNIHDIF